jgi:hypothetical protein
MGCQLLSQFSIAILSGRENLRPICLGHLQLNLQSASCAVQGMKESYPVRLHPIIRQSGGQLEDSKRSLRLISMQTATTTATAMITNTRVWLLRFIDTKLKVERLTVG